jgi:hypothetical protein
MAHNREVCASLAIIDRIEVLASVEFDDEFYRAAGEVEGAGADG